ncbi:hypothetical protein HKX48_007847 [Thoreauomyces humboldtii]|nr:hypothetical protein HKX48_007847 [Thoreauomyces humboldtii]
MEFISKIGQVVLRSRIGPLEDRKFLEPASHGSLKRSHSSSYSHRHDNPAAHSNPVAPPVPRPYLNVLALLEHPEFWRSSMPVNVDIFLADEKRTLLERWVISYEPHGSHRSSSPDAADVRSRRNSSAVSHRNSLSTAEDRQKADLTDLILLVQSLYSYIRLMPLHSILDANNVRLASGSLESSCARLLEKTDLRYCVSTADGFALSPVFDDTSSGDMDPADEEHCSSDEMSTDGVEALDYFSGGGGPVPSLSSTASSSPCTSGASSPQSATVPSNPIAFAISAKLKVYKFRSASTGHEGKLHLSVVYDASVAGMVASTVAGAKGSPVKSPLKKTNTSVPPALHVRTAGPGSYSRSPTTAKQSLDGRPPRPASAPAPSQRRTSASLGSPFPSPTMQKRVLGIAQWRLSSADRTKTGVVGNHLAAGLGIRDPLSALLTQSESPGPPASAPILPLAHDTWAHEHPDSGGRVTEDTLSTIVEPLLNAFPTIDGGTHRPVGIPYGESLRYSSGNPNSTTSMAVSPEFPRDGSITSRKPDLRLIIPPPLDLHEIDGRLNERQQAQELHSRGLNPHPAHNELDSRRYPQHHQSRYTSPHSHSHRYKHRSSHHKAATAPPTMQSATTTIRSINIPLSAEDHTRTSDTHVPVTTNTLASTTVAVPAPGRRFSVGGIGSMSIGYPSMGGLPVPVPYQQHPSSADLFGALVGSYEESILSGRMSSLPSRPIRFLAEIGAIAHGKCHPSLRCPPHVCVPFDAVFYEVGEEEAVSPYVGCIDLKAAVVGKGLKVEKDESIGKEEEDAGTEKKLKTGGYRIPPKGQLQIVIKNPSRTAIKLFLLPYDLHDMPPHSKTILRQKSYATPATPKTPASSTSKPASRPNSAPAARHLRYAIHIPVYRTSRKGAVHLGPAPLRVVFSHRAGDGDEVVSVVSEVGGGSGKEGVGRFVEGGGFR